MQKILKQLLVLLLLAVQPVLAQQPGEKIIAPKPVQISTAELMAIQAVTPFKQRPMREEKEGPDRSALPQHPDAPAVSSYPPAPDPLQAKVLAPQLFGVSFTSTNLASSGAFPPDNMGAIGPTQFITAVNGRIRSHNKITGVADGALNISPDVFFAAVMTPVLTPVLLNFTSDPRIRYDRFTGRWFIIIIDVPCTNATCTTLAPNRVLIAVSDAASSTAITGSTVWTFYQFQASTTLFADYPTLGIDVNALYIGANMFTSAGGFSQTEGYVVPKQQLLAAGPITAWRFTGLAVGTGAGLYTPQGVDNFDPTATNGYFVGVDNAVFGLLVLRRITNPGSVLVSPTISANLNISVPATTSSIPVTHSGNTGGNNGRLDALDDRLYAAVVRNGRLWTAHNLRVSATGVANTAAAARMAVRWYELQNLDATPSLFQSGTIYDNATTLAAARQYWIPTVMVSGQGHAAFSLTSAGTAFFINSATTGRLSGDALGTVSGSPFNSLPNTSNNTAFTYNPPADPGGGSGRRWGDYSYVSLDPEDDMTMWMVNQFCDANNSYGTRVTQLLAPPPATPATCSPASVSAGLASVNVTLTGTAVSGSGFYDPGANLPAPALPFKHIQAAISGSVTVNSVTYVNPTTVILNISTVGSPLGNKNITITNPDGQTATGTAIFSVNGALPLEMISFSGKKEGTKNKLLWQTAGEENVDAFTIERSADGRKWNSIGRVAAKGNGLQQQQEYNFADETATGPVQFYRLKIEDKNGSFRMSSIVRLRSQQPEALTLSALFPNPAGEVVNALIESPVREAVTLQLTDITGKVLLQRAATVESGSNTLSIPVAALPRGTYYVKVICAVNCNGTVRKFVKE